VPEDFVNALLLQNINFNHYTIFSLNGIIIAGGTIVIIHAYLMNKLVYFLILLFCINIAPAYARLGEDLNAENLFYPQKTVTYYKDSAIILIPFGYKQSALYHAFTYEVIDSVVNMLFKNKGITLSIDGYVHPDEGNDTICKYLSLNRALFVRNYILGRGIDSSRIISVRGMGKTKPKFTAKNKQGITLNCRAELRINYPPTEEEIRAADIDEDGIPDIEDGCVNEFGYRENNGCPDKDAVIVPFENQQSCLSPFTYKVLDSVVAVLRENPFFTILIQGHAYKQEGVKYVCDRLANERAEVVKKYLLSRNIAANRIASVKSFGCNRPCNAGKTPQEQYANSRAQLFFGK
jgi:outer membrane protein OmpA-like peptidoglycan-associated protein